MEQAVSSDATAGLLQHRYEIWTERMALKKVPGYRLRGRSPRGYVLQVIPPIVTWSHGEDVEGVGWVPFVTPRKNEQHVWGWYRFKNDAVRVKQTLEQR